VTVPVGLVPVGPKTYQVYGRLCEPPGGAKVVQLLVHGASYSHTYWDFPEYSYVDYMTQHGYATLAIDELGVGQSSHPPSVLVTQNAGAQAIHDVVTAARSGGLRNQFHQVVLVGHSFGSLTAYVEAATYHDVDGVVATGVSHTLGLGALAGLLTIARPALFDPVTSAQIPPGDLGYLSIPGARAKYFYDLNDADPRVVAADEATRSPVAAGVGMTIPEYVAATLAINVPVLIAIGQHDAPFCRQAQTGSLVDCTNAMTVRMAESPFFAPAARLETFVLPGAGHDINLSLNRDLWFAGGLDWLQRRFPA
jgi:pimeloyl-ACP methyl ester carboxylesterase